MSFEPRDYLRHIQIEINFLIQASAGVTIERFLEDATLQRAFVRSIEVIGEAAKQVPDTFRSQHPHVAWRGMVGMRDRLIHGYFGVDYTLVWDVVSKRIPELDEQISSILEA
jgi:uncharacterized protein with HEPN domain